jgi:hypothetical protein
MSDKTGKLYENLTQVIFEAILGQKPQWSAEKRPTVVTSKPANGCGPELGSFNLLSPAQASPFWCASSVGRISGCDRGVAGGRAWR